MAKKSKPKGQKKPVTTKDLEPKDVKGGNAGKVTMQDISFSHSADKASPLLF